MTQPIQDRLIGYLDAFERAVANVAPHAVDAALMWARIDAASGLVLSAAFLVAVSVFYGRVVHPLWAWAKRVCDNDGVGAPVYIVPSLLSLFSLVVTGACLIDLFNIWRWVGIFHPEMWLIHKAISAVTG